MRSSLESTSFPRGIAVITVVFVVVFELLLYFSYEYCIISCLMYFLIKLV